MEDINMKKLALASLLACSAFSALADNPHGLAPGIAKKLAACEDCGQVSALRQEKRKGEGGAVGIVGGAVVGGLLGNQVGHGNGKKLATVGGAVAGGFAGNEVQKHVTSRQVWVTKVTMKDGSVRSFEQEAHPAWKTGSLVKVRGKSLALLGS
jgi:outer membrane lipoprotein SlyB